MKYFFVLGKNPALSIAELSVVFGDVNSGELISEQLFVLEIKEKIDAKKLIKKLGGIIKIGIIKSTTETRRGASLLEAALKLINFNGITGKFKFGISYYGENKFNIKPLGMEIKKYLREKNISCRWVTSRESVLSSVVVEQNKLADKGIEIVLIKNPPDPLYQGGSTLLIGQTLAVQPFKELSFRDYGRPARDDRSGMIPPKLAQIMINLAAVETHCYASLLDPFCGSGTILTEALSMGYNNVIGVDISEKAVNDTRKNIEWIKKNYELRITNYELFNKNVVELSKFIKPNSIDAIVTEPYLGPQRGKVDFKKTIKELENLYGKSLAEFKKVLKPNGRVVMVFPIFRATHNAQRITPGLNGFKIINPIPAGLRKNAIIKLTDRNTIIYGREGQRVWREIVVLRT
ncbi:MAG: methyltransferase domain-containing protein [Actinobacteria bacterium]|nr:methyltransferase domain-containing protein [Actinomycetota bacterium]